MAATEVGLAPHPLIRPARPGAIGQIDEGLFAPLGGLKAEPAEQRQLLFRDVEEGQDQAPRGGVPDELGQEVLFALGRGEQSAADVEILPLAGHRHDAPAVPRPEILPPRLRRQVGVVRPAVAEGIPLHFAQAIGTVQNGLTSTGVSKTGPEHPQLWQGLPKVPRTPAPANMDLPADRRRMLRSGIGGPAATCK